MILRGLVLAIAFSMASVSWAQADDAGIVTRAEEILRAFHGENPPQDERLLHVVYFTPSDREPVADYQGRWQRILEDIQSYFADEMERHGLGRRSIQLPYDDQGRMVIHLVRGTGTYADYGKPDGSRIRDEARPVLRAAGINPDNETLLIICNLSEWDGQRITHKSPYYGGGSPRGGTCWVTDSELLDTVNFAKREPLVQDGEYGKISIGRHNSIFLGGTAHELGHAYTLPHNRERPDEATRGTALMGSGNRTYREERRDDGKGSFLTLAHALRLRTHPQFSGTMHGLDVRASAELTEKSVGTEGNTLVFSGKVVGTPPVYAVVAYYDPAGGGDYDATTMAAAPDEQCRFTLRTSALKRGSPAELRIVALHASGDTSTFRFPYEVRGDGTPDVSRIQTTLLMAPILEAIRADDRREADRLVAALADQDASDELKSLAKELVATQFNPPKLVSVADIPADAKTFPLSEVQPTDSSVGWMRPAYNRLPNSDRVIVSNGRPYVHGIYAHAPARHVYEIGSQWKRLSGEAGMQDGNGGKVVFVLRSGEKELWRSKSIQTGETARFDVPIKGVERLELVVENGGDGNGGDWGVWLNPVLSGRHE
jgi:hypothetical protein